MFDNINKLTALLFFGLNFSAFASHGSHVPPQRCEVKNKSGEILISMRDGFSNLDLPEGRTLYFSINDHLTKLLRCADGASDCIDAEINGAIDKVATRISSLEGSGDGGGSNPTNIKTASAEYLRLVKVRLSSLPTPEGERLYKSITEHLTNLLSCEANQSDCVKGEFNNALMGVTERLQTLEKREHENNDLCCQRVPVIIHSVTCDCIWASGTPRNWGVVSGSGRTQASAMENANARCRAQNTRWDNMRTDLPTCSYSETTQYEKPPECRR